MIAKSVVWKPT